MTSKKEQQNGKKQEKDKISQKKDKNSQKKDKNSQKKEKGKKKTLISSSLKKKAESLVNNINDIQILRKKRDEYNDRTKKFIQKHRLIHESFKTNRDRAAEYRKKRDELNQNVQELKKQRGTVLDKANKVTKDLNSIMKKEREERKKKKEKKGNRLPPLGKIKSQIQTLEQRIITDTLDIKEENEIINKIEELELIKAKIEGKSGQSKEVKEKLKEISKNDNEIKKFNDTMHELSEESQNYHVLMVEQYKENDNKLRKELDNVRKEIHESKVIADVFHNKYRDLLSNQRQSKRFRRYSRSSRDKLPSNVKREIEEATLNDALDKKKQGKKLNIFEARALFENALDKKE
ncbi:MAG: DUF7121 family protein [Promethearchaeota archaeon]